MRKIRYISLVIILVVFGALFAQDDNIETTNTLEINTPEDTLAEPIETETIEIESNIEEPRTAEEAFNIGNEMYQCGNFPQAADYYQIALSKGMITAEVFYNLGNAHFKAKNIAHSVLAFERAYYLAPRDKDIEKNLKYASDFTPDKIISIYEGNFVGFVWDTIRKITYKELMIVFAAFSILATILLFLHLINVLSRKNTLLRLSILFWSLALISAGLFFARKNDTWVENGAIVMVDNIDITSSPTGEGELLFSLHPGTKVAIRDEMGNYYRIMILDGREGWLPKNAVLKILPDK